jgi:hypothetical protein
MENDDGEHRSYRIKREIPELSVSPMGRADWEQGKRERQVDPVFGKPRHRKELDTKTSGMRQPGLENNRTCCSLEEAISERQVIQPALSPAISTRYSPRHQHPTRSKTRNKTECGTLGE